VVALGFVLAVLGAAAWGLAQGRQTAPVFPQIQGVPPEVPLVLSGEDIGFRVERRKGASAVGRFVVRIEGQWVDVEASYGPRVLTTR
jgi:hypothetical protein